MGEAITGNFRPDWREAGIATGRLSWVSFGYANRLSSGKAMRSSALLPLREKAAGEA